MLSDPESDAAPENRFDEDLDVHARRFSLRMLAYRQVLADAVLHTDHADGIRTHATSLMERFPHLVSNATTLGSLIKGVNTAQRIRSEFSSVNGW